MSVSLPLRSGSSGPLFIGDNDQDTLLWDAAAKRWTVGPGGGGGAVASVFGRVGAVAAATGDYDGDQVDNVSGVPGASLSDALDYLLANAGAVASVFGRVGVVAAAAGDYDSDQVDNASSVTGATLSDALDYLLANAGAVASVFGRVGVVAAAAGDYDSDQIDNASNVSGSTVSDALDTLSTETPTPIKTKAAPANTTQTLVVADGNRCIITSLAADITLTLGTAGAGANEGYIVERRDTSAFQVTVINGGPAGPGGPVGGANLYVFPGSVQRSSSFLFDAADWSQGINIAIVVP